MMPRIRIGRVTIEPMPLAPRAVYPDTEAGPYLAAVEALRRILRQGSWALAGGLVIPIAMGRFYRRHSDIDIVLPLSGMAEVVEAFRAAGYELYTNWSITHRARGLLFEYRVGGDGDVVRNRPRHLYVRRLQRCSTGTLLDKIDLYPYRVLEDGLETCNTRRVLSRTEMQRCSLEPFKRPGFVRCLHLHNVANLKSTRSGPKHRLDCAVIRHGPDAARDWFRSLQRYSPAPVIEPEAVADSA